MSARTSQRLLGVVAFVVVSVSASALEKPTSCAERGRVRASKLTLYVGLGGSFGGPADAVLAQGAWYDVGIGTLGATQNSQGECEWDVDASRWFFRVGTEVVALPVTRVASLELSASLKYVLSSSFSLAAGLAGQVLRDNLKADAVGVGPLIRFDVLDILALGVELSVRPYRTGSFQSAPVVFSFEVTLNSGVWAEHFSRSRSSPITP